VHRAVDVQSGRDVAVKEIPVDQEMARRAGAEVRAASRLSHPGIVRLLDFGEDQAACYLVSELVDGKSLAESMRDHAGAPGPAAFLTVVADVLDGLAHAHSRGVTHRDVKPANILVDREGRGRLADFGIARIAGEAGLTTTGGVVGTVSYMAPEQARGDHTGPPADVFSAALVAYEGLTGGNPLVGSTPGETLRRAAGGAIPPLAQARRGLPSALCRAIDGALHPDPAKRPAPAWLAQTLRAQARLIGAAPAPARRLTRAVPFLLTAAAAGAIAGTVLHRTSDLEPAAVAMAAGGVGIAFAALPWHVAALGWIAGMAALGMTAPGLAMIVGALGLVLLVPLRRHGRLVLLPAGAPMLVALGLAPLFAAMAGALRGWRWRLWAALAGSGAALGWQTVAGADPALHGGQQSGTWEEVEGVVSPIVVVERLGQPLTERPILAMSAGVMIVAALVFPAVTRLRPGVPRAVGALVWIVALVIAVRLSGGSVEQAAGAYLGAGIILVAWAASPWRRLKRGTDRRSTVTLRGSTVERLPAA
jgi:hypothetical protein